MKHQYFEMNDIHSGYPLFLLLVLSILGIVIIYFTIYKRKIDNVSPITVHQNDVMRDFSSLVLAMLTQQGKELTQIEISGNLNLPAEMTAEKLLEMEKAGLISRKWMNDGYTFAVKKI
jgi:hypothetical protein